MVHLNTTDDFGFLFSFIGGLIIIVNAVVGLVMSFFGNIEDFIGGSGFFTFINDTWGLYAGTALNIAIGLICLLMGLKIFTKRAWNFMVQIDLIITGIVMIILGVISFGIGGILVIIAGILILVYRLSRQGEKNHYGK
ncbi:MAG: hypothetical protein ACTSXA_04800 [Candidatus Heimdallarchaeota archaeon]